ncbi:MAG: hypothetical protein V5A64_03375 [Candidatus Thermoplasmatota archaeon]
MEKKDFIENNQALAGAIEFLLIIALFALIISYVQMTYIPEALEKKEADHMNEVANQFSHLKANLKIQEENGGDKPIFNALTLGSRELANWVSAPSYGKVEIIPQSDSGYNVTVETSSSKKRFNLTCIQYEGINSYFVDQSYILQSDGIIVKQPGQKSVMWMTPSLESNFNEVTSNIEFSFQIFVFFNDEGNQKISGYRDETCYIQTNYSSTLSEDWQEFTDISFLNISTPYVNAWYEYLNNSLEKKIRNNVTLSKYPDKVSLEKKYETVDVDVRFKKTCIFTRIIQS